MRFGHIQLASLGCVARSSISRQVLEALMILKMSIGSFKHRECQSGSSFLLTFIHYILFIVCVARVCVTCMCMCVYVCIWHSMCVEARGQLGELNSLLPLFTQWVLGLNSGGVFST